MDDQVLDRGVHHLHQGRRPDPQGQDRGGQHPEIQCLAAIEILQSGHLLVLDFAEDHPLDHPECKGCSEDQGDRGQEGPPEIGPEGCEDHHELADETGGSGQARIGHREKDDEGTEPRHRVDHAAVVGDLARMHAVIEHTHTKEKRARDESVRDHLHHTALDPHHRPAGELRVADDGEDDKESEGDETHVRNRRIGDQLLHVLLNQRHESDVDHRDQGQRDDQPVERGTGVRRDRHREAQESVAADLQHDGGQDHRASGRRLDMRVR